MKIGNMGVTNTWILRSLSKSDFLGPTTSYDTFSKTVHRKTGNHTGDGTGYWVKSLVYLTIGSKIRITNHLPPFQKQRNFQKATVLPKP